MIFFKGHKTEATNILDSKNSYIRCLKVSRDYDHKHLKRWNKDDTHFYLNISHSILEKKVSFMSISCEMGKPKFEWFCWVLWFRL